MQPVQPGGEPGVDVGDGVPAQLQDRQVPQAQERLVLAAN